MVAEELLRPCTVRIDINAGHVGTGFFVAPGTVVTCAHVIEALVVSSEIRLESLTVVDSAGSRHKVEKADVLSPKLEDDLAILRLSPSVRQRCVLLDETAVRSRDDLTVWGYPKTRPEGLSRVYESDGPTGAGRWGIRDGQVQPGMSGSPVFNERTRGVCGILKQTRDERQPLGGFAIAVRRLLELEPRLRASSDEYHERDNTWLEQLTEQQRYSRHVARELAGTAPEVEHFVVSLRQAGDRCDVSAIVGTDAPEEELTSVPVDLDALPTEVARVFRDWAASRGRVDAGRQIDLLGSILFSAAFPRAIGDHLRKLLDAAGGSRILVSLSFDESVDDEIVELPWEHLCIANRDDNERPTFIAADERLGLARTREVLPGDFGGTPSPTLSVLTAIALPPRKRKVILQRLEQMDPAHANDVRSGRAAELRLRMLPIASPDALKAELAKPLPCDVLHYVGSGEFDRRDQLALHRTAADIQQARIEKLIDCLPDPPPRLVVLQHCITDEEQVPSDFAVLAPALLDAGVTAVIAYQYPVDEYSAGTLNDTLYDGLLRGLPLDAAVQQARGKVSTWDERAFVSPALFLRRPGRLRLCVPGTPTLESRRTEPAYGADY